jgi:hypothetical protein
MKCSDATVLNRMILMACKTAVTERKNTTALPCKMPFTMICFDKPNQLITGAGYTYGDVVFNSSQELGVVKCGQIYSRH